MDLNSSLLLGNLQCEQKVLKNTDGSAMYTAGETNVLVGVYGPADCKESKQDVKQAVVEVNFRPKIGIPGVAEKYMEKFVCKICESVILRSFHPRAAFSVIVQVMQDQGSLLSCAINAVSMALQDAGISMRCMPVAVTVALQKKEKEDIEMKDDSKKFVISPSTKDEEESVAIATFVFDSAQYDSISAYACGPMTSDEYRECLRLAKEASKHIVRFFRDSVSRKVSTDIR